MKAAILRSKSLNSNWPQFLLLASLAMLSCRNAAGPDPRLSRKHTAGSGPAEPALSSQLWRSETTHNEYRVDLQGGTFRAKWANVPADQALKGSYLQTECRYAGGRWVGISRSKLPCSVRESGTERIVNWCTLETRIEIDSISPGRITGRAQTLRKVDCGTCKILESDWRGFAWLPER